MSPETLLVFAKIVVPPLVERLGQLGDGDGQRVFDELAKLYKATGGHAGKAVHEVRNITSRSKEIAQRRKRRDQQIAELEKVQSSKEDDSDVGQS